MGNPAGPGAGVTVDIFVIQAVRQLHDLSGSRSLRDLRSKSEALLALLESTDTPVSPGDPFLSPAVCSQLVDVLAQACSQNSTVELVELALSTLHKLIAYAFLQGESTASGRSGDGTVVDKVVSALVRTGASPSGPIQLALLRALLTVCTAEHFVAHGDCLMLAVRTVFNVAVGSTLPDIRGTARSALLQTLNTILKRVSQQVVTPVGRSPTAGTPNLVRNTSGTPRGPYPYVATGPDLQRRESQLESVHEEVLGGSNAGRRFQEGEAGMVGVSNTPSHSHDGELAATPTITEDAAASSVPTSRGEEETGQGLDSSSITTPPSNNNDSSSEEGGPPLEEDRSAQEAAALAWGEHAAAEIERRESARQRGVEEESGLSAAELRQQALPRISIGSNASNSISNSAGAATPLSAVGSEARSIAREDSRTARMASMAEQADLRGLERAMIADLPASGPPMGTSAGADLKTSVYTSPESPPDPRRALMAPRQSASAWRLLTTVERDAVVVLGALCRLGARELPSRRALEGAALEGKLLAVELLTRVLGDPQHDWVAVRPEFAGELRAPLCLLLLRNCMSPWEAAVRAAVRLLCTLAGAPRLRAGLRAELGTLFPLLLLRPLEGPEAAEAGGSFAALEGLCTLCAAPQTLVDIFVNYDCSLQASNLFERTVKALSRMARLPADGGGFAPPAAAEKLRAEAIRGLVVVVDSLDVWAGPIKSRAITRNSLAEDEDDGNFLGEGRTMVLDYASAAPSSPPRAAEELEKIISDKAMKSTLRSGIAAFNAHPRRGIKALIDSGLVTDSAEAVASFLRLHVSCIRKSSLGEYLGHHDEFELAVMRAYVGGFDFRGLSLDDALRTLLRGFRLPGEAQKIDRIMEAFAACYCGCNPGVFPSADAAYLLAFAVIMLNTDAHNPMADRRISETDFVLMATYQTEDGEFEAIAPEQDLIALYRRILSHEIETVEIEDEEDNVGERNAAGSMKKTKKTKSMKTDRSSTHNPTTNDAPPHVRLAAALGLGQLAAPFWAGAAWDKAHGVEIERRRLATLTREVVAAGGSAGNLWHTATHAEHARPMLQVCGENLAKGLDAALQDVFGNSNNTSTTSASVDTVAILTALEKAIQLAALLRLPDHLETLIHILVTTTGLGRTIGASTPTTAADRDNEFIVENNNIVATKETAALTLLMALTTSPEASFLGAQWITVARVLSKLDLEIARLEPSPAAARERAASAAMMSFGDRLWSVLGLSSVKDARELEGRYGPSGATPNGTPASIVSSHKATRRERTLVAWYEGHGAEVIDRLLTSGSASLTGAGVVDFVRALCAASQEELQGQGIHGEEQEEEEIDVQHRPRLFLLKTLTQVALANTGRIRIIWSRLWSMTSAHLVGAACHPEESVALVAVDALRRLCTHLLDARPELPHWEHQAEALRPMGHVLRVSDHPAVRELGVACLEQVIMTRGPERDERDDRSVTQNNNKDVASSASQRQVSHSRTSPSTITPHVSSLPQLGSGWRVVLECLSTAVSDPSPAVFRSALAALQAASEMLYVSQGGHTCLAECAAAVAAAALAAYRTEDEAIAALYLTETIVRRLVSWTMSLEGGRNGNPKDPSFNESAAALWHIALSPLDGSTRVRDESPRVPRAALRLALDLLNTYATELAATNCWLAAWESGIAPALSVPPAGVGGDDELELAKLRERSSAAFGVLTSILHQASSWESGPGPALWRAVLDEIGAHLAVPLLAPASLVHLARMTLAFLKCARRQGNIKKSKERQSDDIASINSSLECAIENAIMLLASAVQDPASPTAVLAAVRVAGVLLERCEKASLALGTGSQRLLLRAMALAVGGAVAQLLPNIDSAGDQPSNEQNGLPIEEKEESGAPEQQVDLSINAGSDNDPSRVSPESVVAANNNGVSSEDVHPPEKNGSSYSTFASINATAAAPSSTVAALVGEPVPRPERILVEGGCIVLGALRTRFANDSVVADLAAETTVRVLELGAARAREAAERATRSVDVMALWWPDAYEEAVIVEALKTWEQLGDPAWSNHHDAAWPALSSLITSPSLTLRKAVQSVLAIQLRTQFGTAA